MQALKDRILLLRLGDVVDTCDSFLFRTQGAWFLVAEEMFLFAEACEATGGTVIGWRGGARLEEEGFRDDFFVEEAVG